MIRRVRSWRHRPKGTRRSTGRRRLVPSGFGNQGHPGEHRDVNQKKTTERQHHPAANVEADGQNAQSFTSDDLGLIFGNRVSPPWECWRQPAVSILIRDFQPHLTGRAGDNAEGGFVVTRVQVFALGVHDIHDLFAADLANLGFVRLFRTGGDVGRLL